LLRFERRKIASEQICHVAPRLRAAAGLLGSLGLPQVTDGRVKKGHLRQKPKAGEKAVETRPFTFSQL
jgi:hypothetical protein